MDGGMGEVEVDEEETGSRQNAAPHPHLLVVPDSFSPFV